MRNPDFSNVLGRRIALGLFLTGLMVLSYRVLELFLVPVAWAIVLVSVTWPAYGPLRRLMGRYVGLSALVMTLLLGLTFALPLLWVIYLLRVEVPTAYASAIEILGQGPEILPPSVAHLPGIGPELERLLSLFSEDPAALRAQMVQWMKPWVDQSLSVSGRHRDHRVQVHLRPADRVLLLSRRRAAARPVRPPAARVARRPFPGLSERGGRHHPGGALRVGVDRRRTGCPGGRRLLGRRGAGTGDARGHDRHLRPGPLWYPAGLGCRQPVAARERRDTGGGGSGGLGRPGGEPDRQPGAPIGDQQRHPHSLHPGPVRGARGHRRLRACGAFSGAHRHRRPAGGLAGVDRGAGPANRAVASAGARCRVRHPARSRSPPRSGRVDSNRIRDKTDPLARACPGRGASPSRRPGPRWNIVPSEELGRVHPPSAARTYR